MSYSPVYLPKMIALRLEDDELAALAEWHSREGSLLELHWGAGMLVRNLMRRLTAGWTDQELDDCWERVVLAALRQSGHAVPGPAPEQSTTCTGVHHGE